MSMQCLFIAVAVVVPCIAIAPGEIEVRVDRSPEGFDFSFQSAPRPAKNDAATTATFTIVDGDRDPNGGSPAVLQDGQVPSDEDQPAANFFFRAGSDGGRLQLDLGRVIAVRQVNTYSWHSGSRAPQVYQLYASDGTAAGFVPAPRRGTDPASCGWNLIARVDTRRKDDDDCGQYAACVSNPTSVALGRYRFLLFDIVRTEERDAYGNTFFSEMDVLDADGPEPIPATSGGDARIVRTFEAEGGKYRFTIDTTAAPDLTEWVDTSLQPVVQAWYPQLVAMLPSEGFEAPAHISFRFRNDMGNTPASAAGGRINLSSSWFRRERKREALGAVVHELVHVVQNYGQANRTNPNATRAPGWLVEGIADYIRWFLYEPETKGAEITAPNRVQAKYDGSYRVTANFLDWVTRNHDPQIVRKLNAAARDGTYEESLWKAWTGKTLPELGENWRKAL